MLVLINDSNETYLRICLCWVGYFSSDVFILIICKIQPIHRIVLEFINNQSAKLLCY